MELQMHEEHRVIKLTDVEILPNAGKTILGILEAHVNGFIYTASNFRMVFMHANLEMFFMRLGDKMMPPLLQFHLEHSVTKDIQFCLVPSPLGQVRYEKDNQIRNSSRNEDLKNFVQKVQQEPQSWGSKLPIHFYDLEEFKFCGAFPTGASATCALTVSALVMLEETPFVVFPLLDIEIVNLAQLGPETVDMTVVFKDIKRDVLEIRLVPLKFLTGIKHRLNFGGVKYYVNSKSLDWSMLVKDIREFPKKFIDSGGWGSSNLELEDSRTLAYYSDSDSDSYSYDPYGPYMCY
ncbi:hypothetical protein MKW94_011502 [Papaver nudicaule]|uniref:FACT complex subunit n=1 Tax=Papaver nudicaule TaxID=74823 RepID=A0AA41VJU2_PAPNU|nr:hypothetical protein [Papaver nudicaule]